MLKTIPANLHRKVLRKAMTRAAIPVMRQAQKNAAASKSFDTGLLRDSIGFRVTAKKKKPGQEIGDVVVNIRPLAKRVTVMRTRPDGSKYQQSAKASQYAHHVEFGNKHQSPTPIFRPALEARAEEAGNNFAATVFDEVELITAKAAAKAARAAKKKV